MSFMNKIKEALRRFMYGRRGTDELSLTLLVTALVLMLISNITGSFVLNLLSLILYGFCIFRMFSRNLTRRYEENMRYIAWRQKLKTTLSQSQARLKNFRKYKYFKCPECKSWLRLPRKVGEVTVTCGKCRHAFKKKA